SGAEILPCALQYHHARIAVALQPLEIGVERVDQRRIERVQALRPVERNPVEPVLVFDLERLSHASLSCICGCGADYCALSPCGRGHDRCEPRIRSGEGLPAARTPHPARISSAPPSPTASRACPTCANMVRNRGKPRLRGRRYYLGAMR